ncbi:MAG: FAD-dependent oxidoreductase [Bacteroidetes bacterium]|nr:FAD-dependent oxidoreductase [Bacteroidota bacterium]
MSIVRKYKARVVEVLQRLPDVYTVQLESETGRFRYSPGQFLHLALDEYDPSRAWPESRCFSMQTSPDQDMIAITFTTKGQFTKKMANELTEGRSVWLKMPYGDLFTRDHSRDNCVFLAGGTGVTPFLSLFADGSFAEYKNPRLYLGVRSKDYHIFDREVHEAKNLNPSFRLKVVYQDSEGVISIDQTLDENGKDATFFISGPPVMVTSFKRVLSSKGIADANIRTDEWE